MAALKKTKIGAYKDVPIQLHHSNGLASHLFVAAMPKEYGGIELSSGSLDYLKKQISKTMQAKESVTDIGGIPVVLFSPVRSRSGEISRSSYRSKWYFGHIVHRHDTGKQRNGRRLYDYEIKVRGWKKPWKVNGDGTNIRLAADPAVAEALTRLWVARDQSRTDYAAFERKLEPVWGLTTPALIKKAAALKAA